MKAVSIVETCALTGDKRWGQKVACNFGLDGCSTRLLQKCFCSGAYNFDMSFLKATDCKRVRLVYAEVIAAT